MVDYSKRLVEVSVILNHLQKSDFDKIPKELIDIIEKNKDTAYIWKYDETKDLKDQNLSKDTIAILSYINMQYLLNENQRNFIQKIFNENQKKLENIKKEKYSPDILFKNDKNYKCEIPEVKQSLIKCKEKNIMQKILDKIGNLFKRI